MIGTEGEIKRDCCGLMASGREGWIMIGTSEEIRDCCEVLASGREGETMIGTEG